MVPAVNPCGFALLPAYLGLYLGVAGTRRPASALPQALLVGVAVTASFVLLVGAAGVVISAIGSALSASFPWIGLTVGVVLILVAGRMLAGRPVYAALGDGLADRIGGAGAPPGPVGLHRIRAGVRARLAGMHVAGLSGRRSP